LKLSVNVETKEPRAYTCTDHPLGYLMSTRIHLLAFELWRLGKNSRKHGIKQYYDQFSTHHCQFWFFRPYHDQFSTHHC